MPLRLDVQGRIVSHPVKFVAMPSSSRASRCCSKASRKTKERTQSEDHKAEQGPLVPVTSWVWLVESRRQTSRGLRGPWPHCPRPGRRPATHRNWPGAFDGERSFLQLALLQQRDLLRCRNARRNLFLPSKPRLLTIRLILGAAHENEVHIFGRGLSVLNAREALQIKNLTTNPRPQPRPGPGRAEERP